MNVSEEYHMKEVSEFFTHFYNDSDIGLQILGIQNAIRHEHYQLC